MAASVTPGCEAALQPVAAAVAGFFHADEPVGRLVDAVAIEGLGEVIEDAWGRSAALSGGET